MSMSAGVRAGAAPVAASSAAAARVVGVLGAAVGGRGATVSVLTAAGVVGVLGAGAGVRFTAPRGQPPPGGVVAA